MFGKITDGKMILNDTGKLVYSEWIKTGAMRTTVSLDAFVIMPNHIHGIIVIHSNSAAWQPGTGHRAPTIERFGKPTSNSVPTIIRGFKASVTNALNQRYNTPGFKLWQRNYWEHIIRDDVSMNRLREYIIFNPLKWKEDCFNTVN
jgi:REP element-mobilizing transposase RayT